MNEIAPEPPDLGLPSDTLAVLIPLSDSAIHSSKLSENERLAKAPSATLLGHLTSNAMKLKRKFSLETVCLILNPTAETSQYTLGSDKTGYIFLQTSGKDECWVNFRHCRIIPDPDEDCVVLHNTSTSMFTAQNPEKPRDIFDILPTRHRTLPCGYWRLSLGVKLEFLLLVFRRPLRCLAGARAIAEKSKPHRQEIGPKKNDEKHRRPPPAEDKGKTLPFEEDAPSMIIAATRLTRVVRVMRDGRVTALKICRKPELIEAADMWTNEREILLRLKHPSIVRLLDFDGPNLTLILEYVNGRDLSKFVDSNHMSIISEVDQFTVWRDISSALRYLHDQDITHNDIKPENILLSLDNAAVLCDFGIATSGLRSHCGGTPCYIAPEYLYNERSRPSDLWALGVTMLFVLGFMPLPNGFWKIAGVHTDAEALGKMVDWLGQIRKTRAQLPEKYKLLSGMLMEDVGSRVTARSLCDGLVDLQGGKLLLEI